MDGPRLRHGNLASDAADPLATVTEDATAATDTVIPAHLGRFVLQGILGAGGMGMVFAAQDPVLDRRVAIKLMRQAGVGAAAEAARARLLREAQALARLTHPNVVTVHEAGLVGDAVFIAMELLDGGTLRTFMAEPHSWREIVEVFVAAGRGLAAAHAAGLVHRDFKPANVLIDADGKAKVGDFGLVGLAGEAPTHEATPASPLHQTLTATGGALGTPAYMAPEQVGGTADARADQYAFCVSLHEALTGTRPGGEAKRPMPPRLRSIVARGLAHDPARRHVSMDALLGRLERAARGHRKLRLVVGAGAIALVATATTWALTRGPDPRQVAEAACASGPERLHGTWGADRRSAIEQSFGGSNLGYASASGKRVVELLDGYANSWLRARTDACRATHVTREQSEAQLDLRMQCLDRRRDELGALAVALSGPLDPSAIDRAVAATQRLPRIEDCADRDQLQAVAALPADPSERARVEQSLAGLAEVDALYKLGRYPAARARLAQLEDEARGFSYLPLASDLAYWRGWFHYREGPETEAEAPLQESLRLAVRARDLRREERGWQALFAVLATYPARRAEAEQVRRADELALERAGRPAHAWANHRNTVVRMYMNGGQLEEAEAVARAAIDEIPADDGFARATALQQHARLLAMLHRNQETIEVGQRALAAWEGELGPDHPSVASSLGSLSRAYRNLRRNDEAAEVLRRALGVLQAAYGADSPNLADTYKELARVAVARGDVAGVRDASAKMMAVLASSERTDPENWINGLAQAGGALSDVGVPGEAVALLRRAIERATAIGDTRDGAIAALYLGRALQQLGKPAEAVEQCRNAEEAMTKRFGVLGQTLVWQCQAEALIDLGRTREAVDLLTPTLAAIAANEPEPGDLAQSRFALARAQWLLGNRRDALALADLAASEWDPEHFPRERARLDAWRRGKAAPR